VIKNFLAPLAVAVLLVVALTPAQSSAFQLTASNLSGFVAYDSQYDVVNRFGLDPRLSYEATGQNFNFAAGLSFTFHYMPKYPTINDVTGNPTEDWLWTLETRNISFPGEHGFAVPDVALRHTGSYADLMSGINWASHQLDQYGIEGCYYFDYEMLDNRIGVGTLSLGAWVDNELIPMHMPESFIMGGEADGSLSLTAEPVPEPATMLLFGGGLAGVAVWRRRRRARK
jgi:hypothetical protein